jgi:hypothetical protein
MHLKSPLLDAVCAVVNDERKSSNGSTMVPFAVSFGLSRAKLNDELGLDGD